MRYFSVAPTMTMRGRANKGLRGYSGKPFHPPLTDIPIAAYMFAAVFDLLSLVLHGGHPEVAEELFHAGTWTFLGGAGVSVLAATTGVSDWLHSSDPGSQAWRTVNTHAAIMSTVTVLAIADIGIRVSIDNRSAPVGVVVLSIIVAVMVSMGASFGGTLVFDYGFNVETAGDSPVWHASDEDLLPGQKPPPAGLPQPTQHADGGAANPHLGGDPAQQNRPSGSSMDAR
jgi:uncharacterized membrane protein